jgi:hypothetical protein
VRLLSSQNNNNINNNNTPRPRRIEFDATSRSQRINDEESSCTDQSFGSSIACEFEQQSPSHRRTPPRRMGCMDPVAFTLLKGGEEDPLWLLEQDRSFATVVPKVSANLLDIYGAYSHEMARPVALWRKGPPLYSSSS